MTGQHSDSSAGCPKIRDGLVFRQLDEEWVVYDGAGEKLHVLNRSAAIVWLFCTGDNTVDKVIDSVANAFELQQPREDFENDVRRTIGEFAEKDLLQ